MLAIFKKEIHSFFSSPVGYLIIGLFLLLNGLFLWVLKGQYNIFDYGFANLSQFFLLTPWVMLLIIPAITMKSFSEETKTGTLELLLIKPIGNLKIILGKFLGAVTLVLIALVPTILYVFAISDLGMLEANYDLGLVIGSYIGLILLVTSYTAIGIFTSSLTSNQIVAFLLGLLLSFLFYYGFEAVANTIPNTSIGGFIKNLSMKYHFEGIALGVLKVSDVVYFLFLTSLFLFLSQVELDKIKRK